MVETGQECSSPFQFDDRDQILEGKRIQSWKSTNGLFEQGFPLLQVIQVPLDREQDAINVCRLDQLVVLMDSVLAFRWMLS